MLDFLKRKGGAKEKPAVCAILVAAGSGTRMKSRQSKYFLDILGRPIISYTLDVFQVCRAVDEIVIVTREDDIVYMGDIVKAFSFDKVKCITCGGGSRQESVEEGLKQISPSVDYVMVHDSVRPFITPDLIEKCLEEAKTCDGAVVAVSSKDTLKTADDNGLIAGSLNRDKTYQIQTPQCFAVHTLTQAYQNAREQGLTTTDDSTLVTENGGRVKLVDGSYDNIKITTPEDLFIAESILRKRGELL